MWDSPQWISSAISAKVKKESDAANRLNEANIAEEDRRNKLIIQSMINTTNESIAAENRASNEAIAEANRANNVTTALINAAGRATPKLVPLLFTKSIGDSNNKGGKGNGQSGSVLASGASVSSAQKKADEAFPTLEPTFKDRLNSFVSKLNVGSQLNTGLATGVVSQLVTLSTLPIFM